ncbi:MAG: glycosyltransferase [Bacteroidales bacterium]|nr:glycosyltransferase [Bacteroidales bacterium]
MFKDIVALFTDYSNWKFWLVCSLILAWTIQMCFYLIVFVRIGKKRKMRQYVEAMPISVVICARNEAENISKNLPLILEQEYPDFEVIVVNDASNDDTASILAQMKQKYKNLYVTSVPFDKNFFHGKKLALTVGIKAAKNEWLLLTDADCVPTSKWWIKTMSQNFIPKNNFVLGYGGYFEEKGFLNKLIRYDSAFIAMQYFTYTDIGMPYMGVGRNIAYRKSIFTKSKGFTSHSRLMSGDDDLFVNENAKKGSTVCESLPDSFTMCKAKASFNEWNRQKMRHYTASERYKTKHKFLLALEPFSRSYFYLASIILSFFNPIYFLTIILFLLRYFVFLYAVLKMANKFKIKGIKLVSILFDIVLPYINLIQLILGKIRKDKLSWK